MENTDKLNDVLSYYADELKKGNITSFAPMLHLLQFENKPLTLKKHFQLEPMFSMHMPRRSVLKTGRQVGKSQALAAQTALSSSLLSYFHNVVVQPRFEQIKNFSNQIFRPMIDNSYIKNLILDSSCENNMLIRNFKNGSRVHFGYCLLSADRMRGLSGISRCAFDECQDIDIDHIPIIAETMSASDQWGVSQYSGTPKTTDNTLNLLFEKSSMGELVFPCSGCNYQNIAAVAQDLLKMIGKTTIICAKCGKPLDPRDSFFEFAHPDRRGSFDGYHVSQVTHPIHCTNSGKWQELLYKMETYSKAQFFNEILGEACDESVKLLTVQDIQRASSGKNNDMEASLKRLADYATIICGVDWGGGGIDEQSFTTIAILGQRPREKQLEVIYLERISIGTAAMDEVQRVIFVASAFRAKVLAHDASCAGRLREEMLIQFGAAYAFLIVAFVYVWASRQDMIKYNLPTSGAREYYTIDKTRSLAITIGAIKAKQLLLPIYESAKDMLDDFLALSEDVRSVKNGSEIRVIQRGSRHPDDIAHAINLAANAFWYINKELPSLGDLDKYTIDEQTLELIAPTEARY